MFLGLRKFYHKTAKWLLYDTRFDFPDTDWFINTDGGRLDAGFPFFSRGRGACGVAAISTYLGLPYKDVWDKITKDGVTRNADDGGMVDEYIKFFGLEIYLVPRGATPFDAYRIYGDCMVFGHALEGCHIVTIKNGVMYGRLADFLSREEADAFSVSYEELCTRVRNWKITAVLRKPLDRPRPEFVDPVTGCDECRRDMEE